MTVVHVGLRDAPWGVYGLPGGLQNRFLAEPVWISRAVEGDSPVGERKRSPCVCSQVARVTWNPV